ncbi:seminal vesicle secretory protein 5-like [Meriones unguiculatus]|uniref:seminal vesicle secretory protein 5-like n=1 Tax=Meriones unguiculatus TaxID=10047 RepID=UPI00293E6DDB|nr:seminal vesicle secretory protein 5-like [Meriones unguiculatus]
MNPTSFFLLILLLVLVTETAARRPHEKFSRSSEDNSNEKFSVKILRGGVGLSSSQDGYSRSESSWSSYRSKHPKSIENEDAYEERKQSFSADEDNSVYKRRGYRGGERTSSFTSRMKSRMNGK